jgi:hypothetical protein
MWKNPAVLSTNIRSGGSDINGTTMLASYPDYRFRGPDLLLFQRTVEHSLGKLPVGALFSVDEAKIGLRRDDVSLDHLRHTFSAGLTLHAGGLPVVYLLFAGEGRKVITPRLPSVRHFWAAPLVHRCSRTQIEEQVN